MYKVQNMYVTVLGWNLYSQNSSVEALNPQYLKGDKHIWKQDFSRGN